MPTPEIFFCHPYHSWEKGTVENTNGEIRVYFPKGSSMSLCSPSFFSGIETKINQRFMKCLGFKTPTEMLSLCRKQKEQREIIKKRKHRRSN